jgi:hypothetical protein
MQQMFLDNVINFVFLSFTPFNEKIKKIYNRFSYTQSNKTAAATYTNTNVKHK